MARSTCWPDHDMVKKVRPVSMDPRIKSTITIRIKRTSPATRSLFVIAASAGETKPPNRNRLAIIHFGPLSLAGSDTSQQLAAEACASVLIAAEADPKPL